MKKYLIVFIYLSIYFNKLFELYKCIVFLVIRNLIFCAINFLSSRVKAYAGNVSSLDDSH